MSDKYSILPWNRGDDDIRPTKKKSFYFNNLISSIFGVVVVVVALCVHRLFLHWWMLCFAKTGSDFLIHSHVFFKSVAATCVNCSGVNCTVHEPSALSAFASYSNTDGSLARCSLLSLIHTHRGDKPSTNDWSRRVNWIYAFKWRLILGKQQISRSLSPATETKLISFFSAHKTHTNHFTEITWNSRF